MEKHAEAKITKASNLPDDIIIEPAKMMGSGPISPNPKRITLLDYSWIGSTIWLFVG